MKSSTSKHRTLPSHNSMDQCCLCSHSQSQGNASKTWAVVPRLQPGERLFHAITRAFRREFHSLTQLARLPTFRWHPYSLRRGGATAHYMEFGNLSRTMMRGRWASIKTTRFFAYKDSAVAAAAEIGRPLSQQRNIDRLARRARHPLLHGAKTVPRLRRYSRWEQHLDGCRGTRAALGRVKYPGQGGRRLEPLFGLSGSRPKNWVAAAYGGAVAFRG